MSAASPVLDDPALLAPAAAGIAAAAVVLHAGGDEALGCASLLVHEATAQITSEEVFAQATDPRQYDGDSGTGWDGNAGAREARARINNYLHYLEPFTVKWAGRSVLDVGAGTGWLVDCANRAGAGSVVGLEPSESNVAIGARLYPGARLLNLSFEEFEPELGERFDTVVSVMAFGHIADLHYAFEKVGRLLRAKDAEVLLVVPEYDYFIRPRNGYRNVLVFQREPDVALQMSVKSDGSALADIIRRSSVFYEAAQRVGLQVTDDIPMPPTRAYMDAVPRYRENGGVSMTRLLRFAAA
jgi:SAM-dependent methyltransferase